MIEKKTEDDPVLKAQILTRAQEYPAPTLKTVWQYLN
jgi:hypothetical protein